MLEKEKACRKIKERQADFDRAYINMDAVDHFRFRPTDGVLPYSETAGCRYFKTNADLTGKQKPGKEVTNG
jgi:hypothetical protein